MEPADGLPPDPRRGGAAAARRPVPKDGLAVASSLVACREAAGWIEAARHTVALTGAGISVASGIPDFRSADGLWSRYDPWQYGHIDGLRADPAKVWTMLAELDALVNAAQPNPAHRALAELERRGRLAGIVTQNIDGLHQRAGSRRVVEYHGHSRSLRCLSCGRQVARSQVTLDPLPPRCSCGGVLRPEVVFFGEPIPAGVEAAATALIEACDVLLLVGTSAAVAPASRLPLLARERGARLVEINPGGSELDAAWIDLRIPLPAATALPRIVAAMAPAGSGSATEDG